RGQGHALVLEKPALAWQAATVSGERPVAADHPVAGHHDADGIECVGARDRANRRGHAQALCEALIAHHLAGGNPPQALPDFPLEWRAAAVDDDLVERAEVAQEVST